MIQAGNRNAAGAKVSDPGRIRSICEQALFASELNR